MRLSKELAKIFESELEKVIQREKDNPTYMSQEEFSGSDTPCTDRAYKMIQEALTNVIKVFGLSIAKHRVRKHKELHTKEIQTLSKSLTVDQTKISTRTWWSH